LISFISKLVGIDPLGIHIVFNPIFTGIGITVSLYVISLTLYPDKRFGLIAASLSSTFIPLVYVGALQIPWLLGVSLVYLQIAVGMTILTRQQSPRISWFYIVAVLNIAASYLVHQLAGLFSLSIFLLCILLGFSSNKRVLFLGTLLTLLLFIASNYLIHLFEPWMQNYPNPISALVLIFGPYADIIPRLQAKDFGYISQFVAYYLATPGAFWLLHRNVGSNPSSKRPLILLAGVWASVEVLYRVLSLLGAPYPLGDRLPLISCFISVIAIAYVIYSLILTASPRLVIHVGEHIHLSFSSLHLSIFKGMLCLLLVASLSGYSVFTMYQQWSDLYSINGWYVTTWEDINIVRTVDAISRGKSYFVISPPEVSQAAWSIFGWNTSKLYLHWDDPNYPKVRAILSNILRGSNLGDAMDDLELIRATYHVQEIFIILKTSGLPPNVDFTLARLSLEGTFRYGQFTYVIYCFGA
jgi:hypothetical protein